MFITPAFADASAQAAAAAPTGLAGILQTPVVPLLLVFMVFYLMVIRPQNRRAQDHRKMITGLQKGDKIITGGGLIGTVKKVVSDEEVLLELAENVQVRVARATIMAKKD
ncbi:MAG: preprotein translocase subunit YajC [Alphaproteobacteria bacterium]|nr:preprotein translocase subunit YajC [Alphaproteobacteria bacterium]